MTKLLDVQAATTAKLTAKLIQQLLELWEAFDGWYDGELVRAQARASAALVEAAQAQARRQTIATLRQVYDAAEAIFPDDAVLQDADMLPFKYARERGGVSPEEVWERPVRRYRRMRSEGWSEQVSREAVSLNVKDLGEMDMALAQRDEEHDVLTAKASTRDMLEAKKREKATGRKRREATGYRRILHPELTKGGPCGLCVAAATRLYSLKDLKAIHDGCVCTVAPVTATSDPGLQLNQSDLERIYEAAGSTNAAALKRVRPVIEENGELGPVLMARPSKKVTDMTDARRKKIVDARAADLPDTGERISEIEKRISAARKSIAYANSLPDDDDRAFFIRKTAERRITRYEQEVAALQKRGAA
ncbi:hypothetical protein [Kocuria sp.]|uniref:hypothetical protein n=1 Tax=Kocuria sp. TaxID=1871328 RepID=UPI0026E04838|nr:hypothetical protein [Kocuria sp.]MDO5619280.1 hypothetical protein [Kocuria sp.]